MLRQMSCESDGVSMERMGKRIKVMIWGEWGFCEACQKRKSGKHVRNNKVERQNESRDIYRLGGGGLW